MFNNISWQGYWITIALFTASYYLFIYIRYFRKSFFLEGKKRIAAEEQPFSFVNEPADRPSATTEQPELSDHSDDFQLPAKDTIEGMVYTCMDELNAYLEEAKRSKCVKEEMLLALRSILRKYPAIAASEYKNSVTTVLVSQCEFVCSVHLSAEEVLGVWVEG